MIGLVLGVLAAMVFVVPAFGVPALAAEGAAQVGPAQIGPAQIGPAQLSPMGRPDLCWEAAGNGSPVTLEHCDSSRQGQQWALTSNGVLMNGNGYCLEAETGHSLLVGFDGQCAGESNQLWAFSGTSGQLSSHGSQGCAVPVGSLVPGTEIVTGACAGTRWSFGYSAVTLAAGSGSGTARAGGTAGGGYTATVTAANAASAQIAYGVTVNLTVPRGLTVTGLRAGAGWACRVATLTCSGSLAAGGSARIGVTGRLPAGARAGTGYTLSAAASVRGTSPQPGPGTGTERASVPVAVDAAAAGGAAAGKAASGPGSHGHGVLPAAVLAGLLLIGGGLLVLVGHRSRRRERAAD
ncbi:MAG TPA: ricin-type beta-trefoil lectin domain protein [Streptosporangiaceae bacterium]|nr:ricin-type beta-trefoil lectin domain protein [Streptosporangiaceae bacterium]